jgi:hypothetical protein
MTTLTGRFEDAGGNALSGTLRVTLDTAMVDQSDSPDSIVTQKPVEFAIAGNFSIVVPESQTNQVTYHFEFFQTETSYRYQFADGEFYDGLSHLHTDGQYYTGPAHTAESVLLYRIADTREVLYVDFHAQVPNLSTVEFARLVPTGVTRDTLDSSIARLAELLTTVDDYAERLRGGPEWQGAYNASTYYSYGQAVSYLGASWLFLNPDPQQDTTPSVLNPDWVLLAAKGEAGTTGDDTPYDAVGWNGSLSPPSQNAVRDLVVALPTTLNLDQYAPKASPTFTGTPAAPTPANNSNSTQIPNTSWVNTNFAKTDSPSLTGTPSTSIPGAGDDTGRIAPTSWVRTTATTIATALINAVASKTISGGAGVHRLDVLGVTFFFGLASLTTSNNTDYYAGITMPSAFTRFLAGFANPTNSTAGDPRLLGAFSVAGGGINPALVEVSARNNSNTTAITTQVSYLAIGIV